MEVYVYSSSKKRGYYVYLAEKDTFDVIPDNLRSALGELSLAVTFELSPQRKLAQEDPEKVRQNIEMNGFHIQISDPLLNPDLIPL